MARRELTAGGFAAVECARYFGEVETEDIVQEEARLLQRGKSFKQQHQSDGNVVRSIKGEWAMTASWRN